MIGVKRYTAYDALMQVESNGKFVLASDYDRDTQALKERLSDRALDQMRQLEELIECQTERDALRAQVEAMLAALRGLRSDFWLSCDDLPEEFDARESVALANAALQAKP